MRAVRRRRDDRGAVAVMVALLLPALLIASAMVLDLGLVRVDRQVDKSAADAAALAGAQGMIGGTDAYPFRGVCTAARYLQRNDSRFGSVAPDSSGAWSTGLNVPTANGCTDPTLQGKVCVPADKSTWAKYTWTGTYQGAPLKVTIRSGYSLSGSTLQEDQLLAAQDSDDGMQGCDQLAVFVSQNRKPTLGRLATTNDVVSNIRSVGRIHSIAAGDAPAMLLLKRSGCPVLSTGSSSSGSFIHVYGAVSSNGRAQPGSIHSDSNGVGCSSSLFQGRAPGGIVAYAAPLASNPSVADPTKPGMITSVAGTNPMVDISTVRDALGQVYGSPNLNESGTAPGATEPTGRAPVTRSLVDNRYLTGVRNAVSGAQDNVFGTLTSASAASAAGWTVAPGGCTPSGTITAARVYIDCTDNNGYKGTATINSQQVIFAGKVNPGSPINMPNAQKVYIFGSSSDAMVLGSTFSMHTAGNVDASGACTTSPDPTHPTNKATLFVKNGDIKESNGGLLRLCRTTVFMLGGRADACLPSTVGTAPTQTPCNGTMGTGQLSQTGGDVDWTAPNQYDLMTLPNGDPDPALAPAWSDVNGPEDLALWSESAGNNSSTTYNMNGGGSLRTTGVFMVPNADSFSIGGTGHQDLTNAQYIATSIALNGTGTQITMRVDPNSAIQLPRNTVVGLVR